MALDAAKLVRLVERAKRYPGSRPAGSYALLGRDVEQIAPEDLDPRDDRSALLAYGANASPERLASKLAGIDEPGRLPVLRARLHDHDVVYSAHQSVNGSIAATLCASAGTVVDVHVLLVRPEQHEAITATEINYDLLELTGVRLDVDGAGPTETVHAWSSKHGCLAREDAPVALAAVAAEGRRHAALSEPEAIAFVRDRLDPGAELDAFIAAAISDPGVALARTAELRRGAVAAAL